jgi:peptidoglycan/LPS O-acetylase OafA/YrhL
MLRADWSHKTVLFVLTGEIVVISILTGIVALKQHDNQHAINSVSYVLGLIVFTVLATVWKIHLRFFAWLGEISYSMYLLHGVPLYVLFWLCGREGWVGAPLALYMVIAGILTVGLSWLSFRIAEAPAIQFAHALTSTRRVTVGSPVRVGESAPEKNGS